jgi:hypothetical protein
MKEPRAHGRKKEAITYLQNMIYFGISVMDEISKQSSKDRDPLIFLPIGCKLVFLYELGNPVGEIF